MDIHEKSFYLQFTPGIFQVLYYIFLRVLTYVITTGTYVLTEI